MTGRLVAAIDCGTNSTRLLVARQRDDGFETIERLMQTTRLGAGVDKTKLLSSDALQRVAETLKHYRERLDRHGVDRSGGLRVVATSAVRDARNQSAFTELVESVLGVTPDVINGEQEAALAFAGATAGLNPADGPFLVCDIGGGSTELAWGPESLMSAISLDVGSVRLTEKYLDHEPPLPEELVACISVTELYFDDAVRLHPEMKNVGTALGLAGTFSTTAAVEIGLPSYDRDAIHHFRLTRAAAEDVFRTLATETAAQRIENPGMDPGRADIIVGGLCVLVKFMRYFELDEVLISEADNLDGIVMSLLG